MRLAAVLGALLLLPAPVAAQSREVEQARAEFRGAVGAYRGFVVPHCKPEDVAAYVTARRARDDAFVASLRGTALADDYIEAVAFREVYDRQRVYECAFPPLAPGSDGKPVVETEARKRQQARLAREQHFAGGDDQFAVMMRLRDRILTATARKDASAPSPR